MDLFSGLNSAQIDAVKKVDGPLLILAGAGSGKTKTLTHRIAHLIQNHGVNPDEILAVTFTNKAAKEMRERLAKLLNRPNNWYFMPWMGTFHGICVKILRNSGSEIGIDSNFVIYDEQDREHLIKQALKDLHVNDKTFKPKMVASVISNSKNKMILPEEFKDSARSENQKILGDIYARYEILRRKSQSLDFDDILIEVVKLLQTKSEVRKYWQNQFKFIMIDEYQDTNNAQYQIVKLLVNEEQNIAVVGDDWQSIYSWRGADFTNILNFKSDYPNAYEVKLEQNYRSTGNILSAAQKVIEKNHQRTDKKIWTDAGDGEEVKVIPTRDEMDEAERVVEIIYEQLAQKKKLSDVAILYRTNAQSYPLERALVRAKLPHKIIGGMRFFDRKEIKDVLAYLKLVYQRNDSASLNRIINVPTRGIGKTSVDRFMAFKNSTDYDFYDALANVEEAGFTKAVNNKFADFYKIIESIIFSYERNSTPQELIEKILKETKYEKFIDDGTEEGKSRLENLSQLVNIAAEYAELGSFLEDAALMSSADEKADDDKISLMTMHAAKGLEFPVVIIVGMEEGVFPHARVFESPAELEEERRLCYVAMTRAKEELYLTYAQSRMVFGKRQYSLPSQFLSELKDEYEIDDSDVFVDDTPIFNDYEIGDDVYSPAFGRGVVVDLDGLAVSVRFADGKLRKLNVEYANLTKQ